MSELSGSFHLGYPRMDRDHDILFNLFCELEAAARTRADDGLKSIFLRIHAHLRAQFDNESSLMEAHSYSGLIEHEQEHEDIAHNWNAWATYCGVAASCRQRMV